MLEIPNVKKGDVMNKETLNDFVKYCEENPKQRFWQALRNWSGFKFVWVSDSNMINDTLQDTFYFENKIN
jgi:hypothetical protein